MSYNVIEEYEVRKATKGFQEHFGAEAVIEPISIEGRVLLTKFSGHLCYSCGLSDYFDDYAITLGEMSGVPYAVWDYDSFLDNEPFFLVRIVKLDFLDEIREAMNLAGELVKQRMMEFKEIRKYEESLFKELCFCILTANYKAEGGIRIQRTLGNSFCSMSLNDLAQSLRSLGYRFPMTRARYIFESRRFYQKLSDILKDFRDGVEAREWLVENIKGFGYKEASHFLRNIGFQDVAIIDRHILRFLVDEKLLKEAPKTLNKTRYIKIEKLLLTIGNKLDLSLGELDLYLWYIKTGKILK